MKNIQNKIRITFLITLISVTTAFADDDPGFGYDGDPGTPAAPIENYISIIYISNRSWFLCSSKKFYS